MSSQRVVALSWSLALLAAGCARAAADECNPYYPTPKGARWVYEVKQGETVLRRSLSVAQASTADGTTTAELEQTIMLPGDASEVAGRATTTVLCTASGSEVTTRGSAGPAPGHTGASDTVTSRGAGLPPQDKLRVGYTWRSEATIDTTQGGKAAATSRGTRGSKVEAIEPVGVPAGQFAHALKVESVENLTIPGAGSERVLHQEIVEWYVRGVGLVKRQIRIGEGKDAQVTTEQLVEMSGLKPAAD
jgi:hypothetical protein